MKKIIALVTVLLLITSSYAQETIISGNIIEVCKKKKAGKKGKAVIDTTWIPGATVCLVKDTDEFGNAIDRHHKTYTDDNGKFYYSLPYKEASRYNYLEVKTLDYTQLFNLDNKIFSFDSNQQNFFVLIPPLMVEIEIAKPAIYLYPTKTTEITVLHDFKGEIGTTFPDYNDGWQVTAQPNGELRNKKDNRKYEYLFWDGTYAFPKEHYDFKNGFVVNSKDNVAFLLDKLTLIGLNEKETNDFMVYWLPMLNQNPINFIHFRINDNIDNSSILNVSPEPDSWIRLFMEFKPVDASFSIPEQQLKNYPRKGFTLVEWGGGKIEQNFVFQ